jgi:hypothetical protein
MGLVLPSGQKLTLGLLAIISLEVVPFCAYTPFPVLLPFLNVSWKSCSVPPAILTQLPQLYQNGGLSVLSSIGKMEKSGVGEDKSCFWSKKIPWCNRKSETASCCDAIASSLSPKFEVKASHIFSLHKTSQYYAELIVGLPGRIRCEQMP